MDKKINLFNIPSPTEDEILDEQAQQQVAAEELKISTLPPEIQEAARQEMLRRLMNSKPTNPLVEQAIGLKGQRRSNEQEQALSERSAMENYKSPQAQAIRDRFGGQTQSSNTTLPPGLLDEKPRLKRPTVNPERQALMDIRDAIGREQYENIMNSNLLHKK